MRAQPGLAASTRMPMINAIAPAFWRRPPSASRPRSTRRVFFNQIIRKCEGTRLGRQELEAELLEDTPGALWSHSSIGASRLRSAPEMTRVVVAIDPAVTSGEEADETGIVVAGKD